MTNIKLPLSEITSGGNLFVIASNLANVAESKLVDDTYVYYASKNQQTFESIINHQAILDIVEFGGEIINYIMYAELPFQVDGVSIYNCDVPEGLQKRTMKVTDGSQIVEGVVKKVSQWVNADLQQTFSSDFTKIYVLTNPLNGWLTGSEMVVFVQAFNTRLLTRSEYNQLNVIE